MTQDKIPERVKLFIFNHVDSVELLEVLFTLRANPNRSWSINSLNDELRSSSGSIKQRIRTLEKLQLVKEKEDAPHHYSYCPVSLETDKVISELWEAYQMNRYTIFELIFSPMKKARDFADAFLISKSEKDSGGNNG